MQDEVKVSQADDLIEALSDEADLCRNDGANDIADLLDEARKWIAHQAERETLARMEPVAWMYERRQTGEGIKDQLFSRRRWVSHSEVYTETPLYALPPAPEAGQ